MVFLGWRWRKKGPGGRCNSECWAEHMAHEIMYRSRNTNRKTRGEDSHLLHPPCELYTPCHVSHLWRMPGRKAADSVGGGRWPEVLITVLSGLDGDLQGRAPGVLSQGGQNLWLNQVSQLAGDRPAWVGPAEVGWEEQMWAQKLFNSADKCKGGK